MHTALATPDDDRGRPRRRRTDTRAYVAVKPCGCVAAVRNAGIERRDLNELREQLLAWRDAGGLVQVVSTNEALNRAERPCSHGQTDEQIDNLVAFGESAGQAR